MEQKSHPLFTLLVRTRLFPKDEAKRIYQSWLKESKGGNRDPVGFGKWLAGKQYVTKFQASLLSLQLTHGYYLDQYKILERVGRGRMAGVYRAVHEVGQTVAIKILPPTRARDPEILARFQREARLALRLQHPNIVRAFHLGQAEGCHFLVMEYLEGESLEELLQQRKRLPPPVAARLMAQALAGLQHIHEKGLVHRDIKPGNLMLIRSAGQDLRNAGTPGTLKILDIGLGRAMFDEAAPDRNEDQQLTAVGQILGTPAYMSPEQARDARLADIRSDIYSLGCVFYHALAGQPPFPDTNLINQMVRHATEAPRKLSGFKGSIPPGLQQVVERMMAKDPCDRYPTPERAGHALQVFAGANETPAPGDVEPAMRHYLDWLAKEATPSSATDPGSTDPTVEKPGKNNDLMPVPEVAPGPDSTSSPPLAVEEAASVPASARPEKASSVDIDVELQPQSDGAISLLRLSRRDFLMLGIGAASILLAVFCGWLLAKISGSRSKRS
jgi:serine/threonine protein kinase